LPVSGSVTQAARGRIATNNAAKIKWFFFMVFSLLIVTTI
jgi:hypothetical protein